MLGRGSPDVEVAFIDQGDFSGWPPALPTGHKEGLLK
jgi:hypothetical protein